MGMNVGRNMDFRKGNSAATDVISVKNDVEKSSDSHVEQMRQKVGTEFTSDVKRTVGKKKNELGKDDFMKLMSAQLKYQDPISPMKNEEMAAQLAQFSSLEQMQNVNTTLEKMVAAQKPSEHMLAASLIGKRVSTDSTHFTFEKGTTPEIEFKLPADAAAVNVAIVDAKGEVVREIELGEMQHGAQSVRWDGKNSKFQDQPLGEYSYKITAADKNGKSIPINSESSGIVTGITFEGGKSLLIVGDKKVSIERVGKIESDPGTLPEAKAPAKTANSAKGLAVDKALVPRSDKQNVSSAEGSENTSTQVAKNSLPPGLTPEKIKSMIASMGGVPQESIGTSIGTDGTEENAPLPLWNPATN